MQGFDGWKPAKPSPAKPSPNPMNELWVNLKVTLEFVWQMDVALTSLWGHVGHKYVVWQAWWRAHT